ncbi:MAG: hypothetical protein K2M76_06145 [Muribaculaceae bacterium]|nr:hypothetical protein [Muribaculaceae bacterium]
MNGVITRFLCNPTIVRWVERSSYITWWLTNLVIIIKIMVGRYIDSSSESTYFKYYLVLAVLFNLAYIMSLLCARARREKLPWNHWMNLIFVVNMLFLILEPLSDKTISISW